MKKSGFVSMASLVLALALLCGMFVACNSEKAFQLNETQVEMEQYEEYTLSANKEGEIVWESSDPRTVRVENGKLTSLKLGNATITATLGEETATCDVTVKVSSKGRAITVDQEEVTVAIGGTQKINAQLKENGTPITSAQLVWASDNPSAVSVDNSGTLTGVASGSATITISTTYKGQALSKEVKAACIDDRHVAAELGLVSASADGTLEAYEGDVTELGFAAGTVVTEWVSATQSGSAIWIKNADVENYERLVLDIILTEGNERNITVHNAGEETVGCGGVIGTHISSVLYYNADGTIATKIEPDTVYTMVVDLRKGGQDTADNGIMLNIPMTAYVANGELCSNEYYLSQYEHQVPAEPITAGLYIAKLEVNPAGTPYDELGGKETEGDYAGMYKVACMTDIWGGRLGVANSDMLGYQGQAALHFKYREYDYYGFDMVFNGSVPDLTIWTGGYALFIRSTGVSAEGGNDVKPEDIYIYDEEGVNVVGQALEAGKRYTFKIRIQKDDTDNASFGIGVPGTEDNYFYIGMSYFLKNN